MISSKFVDSQSKTKKLTKEKKRANLKVYINSIYV